ncbi:zinc-ribbon domain-containing protein [Dysgonomonas alginatilytica]|uniref:zinc-ribbon domain-containing protein n=1 Tax=Dysgonomonas alginatilytica TaxID=1605892 RepID=UPI001472EDFB|nr:zinc-ribbon domain-containing protein [Dysgonomonas alginatilytica]
MKIYRSCSDCQAYNSLSVIPVFKYAHLFWIPLFYCGKDYILHCDSCGLYYQGDITVDKGIAKNIKPPLWMFSGLIVIVLFLSYLFWDSKTRPERNKQQALELVANPQKGDIYEVKFDEKEFGLYKVDRVENDSVYFLVHDYAVANAYEVSQLEKGEYSDSYTMKVGYRKDDLKEIVNEGYILKVSR